MNQIRKISVGTGHPDNMMHYQLNKNFNLAGEPYTISSILVDRDLLEKGKIAYNVYISNSKGEVLWKTIMDVPCVVEYNITFD